MDEERIRTELAFLRTVFSNGVDDTSIEALQLRCRRVQGALAAVVVQAGRMTRSERSRLYDLANSQSEILAELERWIPEVDFPLVRAA